MNKSKNENIINLNDAAKKIFPNRERQAAVYKDAAPDTIEALEITRKIMESASPLKECLEIFLFRLNYGVRLDGIMDNFLKKH